MITTRWGNEVEIISYHAETYEVGCRRTRDGKTYTIHLAELRADGGIQEIMRMIESLSQESESQE